MKLDRPISDLLTISWNKWPVVYLGDLHIRRHLRKSVFLCATMISLSSKSFKTELRNFYSCDLMEVNINSYTEERTDDWFCASYTLTGCSDGISQQIVELKMS